MDHHAAANDNELNDLLENTLGDFFIPSASTSASTSASASATASASSSSTSTSTNKAKPYRDVWSLPEKDPGPSPFEIFNKKHFGHLFGQSKAEEDESKDNGKEQSENVNSENDDPEKVKQKLDEILNDFIEKEPQLRDQWQKLSESCKLSADSDEAFETLNETLKSLSESAKSINNAGDVTEEELSRLWDKLGIPEGGNPGTEGFAPEVFSLVTNLMQNLLSKQVLYPSIKDLSERYPDWLEEHRNELEEVDLERYTKQLNLMKQVCFEFDQEDDSDSLEIKGVRFQKILKIMQEMKDCGSPPKELVGDVPDIGSDIDFGKLTGMPSGEGGSTEQGCFVM